MTTEIVHPVASPDGIMFYVSSDGERAGISIMGLERLIGFEARGSLFAKGRKLNELPDLDAQLKIDSEWLNPVQGKVFYPQLKGIDGAKIVTQEAAVAIITYEAVERNNPVAMNSLAQFAQIGFNTWVKQITSYSEEGKYDKLISMMQKLMDDVEEMKVKVDRLDRLDGTTVIAYPGLKQINDNLSAEETRRLLSDQKLYTVKDWLTLNSIELSKPEMHRLTLLVAETYRTLSHKDPETKYLVYEKKTGGKANRKEGNGYRLTDFHIIEAAYEKLYGRTSAT